LAFASSITVNADLLIVDEALSVGDVFFQQKCYHKIRDLVKSGVTILLVSHDMRSVAEFCEEVLLLDKGKVVYFGDAVQAINEYYAVSRGYLRLDSSSGQTSNELEASWKMASRTGVHQLESVPEEHVFPDKDAVAKFLGFAVFDQKGVSTNFFWQGDWLHLIFEVGIATDLENVSPGIVIRDDRGAFLHGKYEFQVDPMRLRTCKKGEVFRASYAVRLDLNAGYYTLSLVMVSLPVEATQNGKLSFGDFDQKHVHVCGTGPVVSFTVSFNPDRPGAGFTHLGTFDLPTHFGAEQDEFFT
jgi:lipopolysaccharide transport system ATP-binding protein